MPATRIPCSLPGFIDFENRVGRQQVPRARRRASACRGGQSWAEETRDGRRVEGLLAHPLGQLGARARAAPAALLRPPRLARGPRPADLPVCAALPRSLAVQRLRRRGGGGGDGRGARAGEGGLEIFARLRRARISARLRRAVGRASGRRRVLELHGWHRFGVICCVFSRGEYGVGGVG